jgi:hypothetical protein
MTESKYRWTFGTFTGYFQAMKTPCSTNSRAREQALHVSVTEGC